MNESGSVSIAVALVCILAVGVSASAIETSVSGEPVEGGSLNTDQLPVGGENAAELVETFEGLIDEVEGSVRETRKPDDSPNASVDYEPTEESAMARRTGTPGVAARMPAQPDRGDQHASESQGFDLNDGLRALPSTPLALLPVFGPFVFAIGYRYAGRLRTLLGVTPVAARFRQANGGERDWFETETSNEVSRAWFRMVRSVDIDRPRSKTPTECATIAVAAGMEPVAVRRLTRAFEEVRYGGAPMTDERRRLARNALRELDVETGGEWA